MARLPAAPPRKRRENSIRPRDLTDARTLQLPLHARRAGMVGDDALVDYPHPRHSCAVFKFDTTNHKQHCPNCWCVSLPSLRCHFSFFSREGGAKFLLSTQLVDAGTLRDLNQVLRMRQKGAVPRLGDALRRQGRSAQVGPDASPIPASGSSRGSRTKTRRRCSRSRSGPRRAGGGESGSGWRGERGSVEPGCKQV